jgi:hypothetical protein
MLGLEYQRLLIASDCLVEFELLSQHVTEVAVHFDYARVELQ